MWRKYFPILAIDIDLSVTILSFVQCMSFFLFLALYIFSVYYYPFTKWNSIYLNLPMYVVAGNKIRI